MTSLLRVGTGLGREESGIIVPENLSEVCLYSKSWGRFDSTQSKKLTGLLTKSTLRFLDVIQVFDFISCHEETPGTMNTFGS